MNEINDELTMTCAQCCRKHLSAAIAYWADQSARMPVNMVHNSYSGVALARALINLCEATEGYASHLAFARGLLVQAEELACEPWRRKEIRAFRLAVDDGKWPEVPDAIMPHVLEWHHAHVTEAEREYPDIVTAVVPEPLFGNESEQELRQAEVNYRLAQLKWLDENVFGQKPVEKGEEEMAMKKANPFAKKGAKADPKAAKKAACKGGKCKGGCKK